MKKKLFLILVITLIITSFIEVKANPGDEYNHLNQIVTKDTVIPGHSAVNLVVFQNNEGEKCALSKGTYRDFDFNTDLPVYSCGSRIGQYYLTCDNYNESVCNNPFGLSKYWKITDINSDRYGFGVYIMTPFNYENPVFTIECNPNTIEKNETSICSLKVKYYSVIKNISFKLDTDLYEIIDVNYENLSYYYRVSDGIYSLQEVPGFYGGDLSDSYEGTIIPIMSFTIKNNTDDPITTTNNIKVIDINYVDGVESGNQENVNATVNTKTKDEKTTNTDKVIKNPLTDTMLIDVLLILGCIGVGSLIIIKLKKKEIYGK